MQIEPHVDALRRQLAATAEAGGDDVQDLAERLLAALEPAFRLALQDALADAAEEITCELAPGSVELRVRGRDLEFAVTPPPADRGDAAPGDDGDDPLAAWEAVAPGPGDGDDGGVARINLRLPDHLKARVERAAGAEGLSVNAWLVRAAAAAVERADAPRRPDRPAAPGAQRFTGWAR
jgi:hypothetical protein